MDNETPDDRYVYVEAIIVRLPAKCPRCQKTKHHIYRTNKPEEDGSVSRYAQCTGCAHKFIIVEIPAVGKVEIPGQ